MSEQIHQIYIDELIAKGTGKSNREIALLNNPFVHTMKCCQLIYLINDDIAGSVTTLPLQVIAHGKVYNVCAGSSLSVEPRFRGKGIATKLIMERLSLSEDKVAIASGMSGMSYPLFKKLGFTTFLFPRFILLKHSRPVLEKKLKGLCLKIVASVCDAFLAGYIRLHRRFSLWEKKRYVIQEVFEATTEVETIVAYDGHTFMENHTKEWFNWMMNNTFTQDPHAKQHLFYIKKDDKTVAFFMTKERFYQQASHRGFKDVILGSVIEWGSMDKSIPESVVCKTAILSFGNNIDVVELCTADRTIIRRLKRWGLVHIGNSNFAIKSMPESPLSKYEGEYSDLKNWRIRPAMSDNGIS